jgi:hypothetical protein
MIHLYSKTSLDAASTDVAIPAAGKVVQATTTVVESVMVSTTTTTTTTITTTTMVGQSMES